ncbi:hypothetical protein Bca4012_007220 [Brassica carinata]
MKRPFYPGVITKDSISYFVALQGVESVSDDRVSCDMSVFSALFGHKGLHALKKTATTTKNKERENIRESDQEQRERKKRITEREKKNKDSDEELFHQIMTSSAFSLLPQRRQWKAYQHNAGVDTGKAFLPLSTSSKALPPPAAEAATTTTVDEKEPEPAIKAATAQVTIDPATETATEQVITEPTKTEAKPKPYPRPLSPYASYPYLKPPTSPTPVSSKGLPAPAPVAAEAATTTIVDEPEPELEPAIKAATAQVNSEPAAKAATEQVITKAKPKSYSRRLSPYASVNLQTKATNYKETRKIVKPQLGLHLV